MDAVRSLNPWAVLVLLTFAVLTVLGNVSEETLLAVITGLAIPAQASGYQTVGPRAGELTPTPVEVVSPDPLPVAEVDEPVGDLPPYEPTPPRRRRAR